MPEPMSVQDAQNQIRLMQEDLENACAVYSALYEVGAPDADTRWKWSKDRIRYCSRQLHALRIFIETAGKGLQ